jgi:aminoglycoside phosphotransferase (APT) family kinase protein
MSGEIFILPEPLGKISRSQVQRALDLFELGKLESVTSTTTGSYNYNQTAYLQTSSRRYVLKGAPREAWQFAKEQFFSNLVASRTTLGAPWPFHYYPQPDIFDWPFAIMPRLDGEALDSLPPAREGGTAAWKNVARAQAIALVHLQAPTFDCAGDFSLECGGIQPYPGSYADWVLEEILARLSTSPSLSAAESRWVTDLARRWSTSLVSPKQSVIVHGDFGYWNMLFTGSGEDLRVSGVYDLVIATLGDNLADLAYQHSKYVEIDRAVADYFLEQYLALQGQDEPTFAERFHLYMLYERLNLRDFAYRNQTAWIDWNMPLRDWLHSYFPTDSPYRDES